MVTLAGCGGSSAPRLAAGTPLLRLPGWRVMDDPPGIGELAPRLQGLRVAREADPPALVRAGDAIRTAAFELASAPQAALALARARAPSYSALLVHELHGRLRRVRAGNAAGYRLSVGRPAEPGRDTVELYALRHGRTLVLVELISARGFRPSLRDGILARLSR